MLVLSLCTYFVVPTLKWKSNTILNQCGKDKLVNKLCWDNTGRLEKKALAPHLILSTKRRKSRWIDLSAWCPKRPLGQVERAAWPDSCTHTEQAHLRPYENTCSHPSPSWARSKEGVKGHEEILSTVKQPRGFWTTTQPQHTASSIHRGVGVMFSHHT